MEAPPDFAQDVADARCKGAIGDLLLLADEARGYAWEADGVRRVDAAYSALTTAVSPDELARTPKRLAQAILFTGHMVDRAGRPPQTMRFPRTAVAATRARKLIEDSLQDVIGTDGGTALGIAGGACGGDILFHESCAALGIATRLYLLLPPDQYEIESVRHGGADWVERFRLLCARVPPRVLQHDKTLPSWLAGKPGYDIWQRNNRWLMFNALALGARRSTLIALFNREGEADGPGGTAHLVATAQQWGFAAIEIDGRILLAD